MKDKIKKKIIYILPAFIVMTIMLITFMVKGVYPFGDGAILEIDADHNYVPTLFKIYDIFHYGDSFLWDFKLGSGSNIYGSLVMNSIYSPLNWLVILVKRNNIVQFFNILLIIKFMCMATTMFIFIRKNFKQVETFWQIILSIIYVFSGWGLLMFSNIFYIDAVILFPIVMHYLIKLFKEGKSLGLIITLSYSVILNIYLSYMIYLFIIFSSLIAILLFIEKSKRKELIVKLSFSLVLPLIISAFSSLPTVVQILNSIRNKHGDSPGYFYYFFLKTIYLTMSGLIITMFIKYIKTTKTDKTKIFYILLFIMTTIGVIVEPINRIWHTGSYNSFPYRYSFISIFVTICACLKYLSMKNTNSKITRYKDIIMLLLTCEIVIIIFVNKFSKVIIREVIAYDITKPGILLTMIIVFISFCIIYSNILKINKPKIKKILISIMVLFEIGIYINWCLNDYKCMQSNYAVQYKKESNFQENNLYKYVDYQSKLGENSSYIIRKATLANWLHIIPKKQHDFVEKFGYAYSSQLIYGYGGTVLSDLIIGTKHIYSQLELPENIFELEKTFEIEDKTVYTYSIKYDTSFGLLYKNKVEQLEYDSMFDTHNYYYKQLFETNKNLINIEEYDLDKEENEFTLKINEPVVLYMEATEELLKSNIKTILLNDEKITYGNSKKIIYIDGFDKDIKINISKENNDKTEKIKFGYIKISDLKHITKKMQVNYNEFDFKKNRLHINIDSNEEQFLFLPINNIDGWHAKNNGKTISIEDELYSFISIKLEKGNNDIEFEFTPPLLKEGVITSILSILLLIAFTIFEKKISNTILLQKLITPLYYFISFIILIYVYIISNFIYR